MGINTNLVLSEYVHVIFTCAGQTSRDAGRGEVETPDLARPWALKETSLDQQHTPGLPPEVTLGEGTATLNEQTGAYPYHGSSAGAGLG